MSNETKDMCWLNDQEWKQCCCNCVYLRPVHFHCSTEPMPSEEQKKASGVEGRCVCGVQKGWACTMSDGSARIYDNWPQHSVGCECYLPKDKNHAVEYVLPNDLRNVLQRFLDTHTPQQLREIAKEYEAEDNLPQASA